MKTIKLSNLDPDGEDIIIQLSGDLFKINWGPDQHRYRLSRTDLTRLDIFIDDLAQRYALEDRQPRYSGCEDYAEREFNHIEKVER